MSNISLLSFDDKISLSVDSSEECQCSNWSNCKSHCLQAWSSIDEFSYELLLKSFTEWLSPIIMAHLLTLLVLWICELNDCVCLVWWSDAIIDTLYLAWCDCFVLYSNHKGNIDIINRAKVDFCVLNCAVFKICPTKWLLELISVGNLVEVIFWSPSNWPIQNCISWWCQSLKLCAILFKDFSLSVSVIWAQSCITKGSLLFCKIVHCRVVDSKFWS